MISLPTLPTLSDCFAKVSFVVLIALLQSCQSLPTDQARLYERNLYEREYVDIYGSKFKPRDLNSTIVIFNFWASWCLPCIQELPSMIKLKKHFSDQELTIISINTETENQMLNIKKAHQRLNIKNEFIHVADQQTMIADSVLFTSIPASVIFKNGRALELINGPRDFASSEFVGFLKKIRK